MPAERIIAPDPTQQITLRGAWVGWCPLVALPSLVIALRSQLLPWVFMWSLAVAIFAGLKWRTWWTARMATHHPQWRSVAYLLAWPGMDAMAFLDVHPSIAKPRLQEWIWATAKTMAGIGLLWFSTRHVAAPLLQGWIGLFGLVLILHFGFFHLIALFWQSRGVAAMPIMAKPILSRTLSEFWGKRWNLGFRQLAYDLIFQPLHKQIGVVASSFLVFLASGLIHDLVISLPARGGYGLPTGYFLLQGMGVSLERSSLGRRLRLQRGFSGWLFMFVVTAAPAFWLFHPFFVTRVILPFMHAIGAL